MARKRDSAEEFIGHLRTVEIETGERHRHGGRLSQARSPQMLKDLLGRGLFPGHGADLPRCGPV